MITKEIVKDYAKKKCQYMAYLMMNEKYLLRAFKDILDKNPDALFKVREDDEEENNESSLFDFFASNPALMKEVKQAVKEKFENDPATLFIEDLKNHQEVSELSMRYMKTMYEHVYRADTFDGSIDGAVIESQEQIEINTLRLLNDPKVQVILEGQFTVDDLRARFDILIKKEDGLYLYEVKGTNAIDKNGSVKDQYLYDLAFQLKVYKEAGIKLKSIGYIHLNQNFNAKNYPLEDDELDKYFVMQNYIDYKPKRKKVEPIRMSLLEYFEDPTHYPDKEEVTSLIDELRYINSFPSKPATKLCYSCRGCELQKLCHDKIDTSSILKLTASTAVGGHFSRSKKLIEEDNVQYISEIDEDYINEKFPLELKDNKKSMARLQIEYAKKRIQAKNCIEFKLMEDIINSQYNVSNLVFFDFETFMYPVPLVNDAKPWEQICCQYSMHVVKRNYSLEKHDFDKGIGGNIRHYEFIGNPRRDRFKNPERDLLKTLKEQLENEGIDWRANDFKLIVYNQTFEVTQFKRMGAKYAEYAEFCSCMKNAIVDLMEVFSRGYWYQECFHGRYSLKVTQPNLIKDPLVASWYNALPYDLGRTLNYKLGYIQNGGIALDVFQSLLRFEAMFKNDEGNIHDLLINSLLSYCKIDSWGTVILYDIVVRIIEEYKTNKENISIDDKFLLKQEVKV